MNIGVLGTGTVGRTIAEKLVGLGHRVTMGTRDPEAKLSEKDPDERGRSPLSQWRDAHPDVRVETLGDAAAAGELIVNATSGAASLEALETAGEDNLSNKIVLDIANPLDFSGGVPTLTVANDDSLAEQIQRRFPQARVVKALNTVTAAVMVAPEDLAGGDHTVILAGNDAEAKDHIVSLLRSFGWSDLIDVGDITSARGLEMYLPLWIRLMGVLNTPRFNIKIVTS